MAGCTECKACGAHTLEDDNFCRSCGAALGCKKVIE